MSLIGHDNPWREWRAALGGPRMHHGWILSGKRGIGKMAFAMQAARELVAVDGVAQPAGNHPDIIVLSHLPKNDVEEKKRDEGKPYELKRNITVDQIRQMQHRLTTRPTLGPRRAIIIDPADDLEKNAANALLKSLEEPPEGTFFILVAHRLGRLLPTIRSRCRILRFPQLSNDQIDLILHQEAPEADEGTRQAAIAASVGSPGAALDFVELGLGPLHAIMQRIALEGDPGFELRGKLSEAMGARPPRDRQLAAIELARSVVTDAMHKAKRRELPAIIEAHAALNRLAVETPTYNFDPGLLAMEIGGLLAGAASPTEPAHG
jgi:DNA polymerase-3 subunit delta'